MPKEFDLLKHRRTESPKCLRTPLGRSACIVVISKISGRPSLSLDSHHQVHTVEADYRLAQLVSRTPKGNVDTVSIPSSISGAGGVVCNLPHATILIVLPSNTPYRCTYKSSCLLV